MVPERGRYLFVSETDTLDARGDAPPKQGAPSMQSSASTSGPSAPPKSSARVRLHTVAYHGLALRLPGWGLVSRQRSCFGGRGFAACRAGHRAATARGNHRRSGDANARRDAPAARRDGRPRLRGRRGLRDGCTPPRSPTRTPSGASRGGGSTGSSPTPASRTPRSTTTTSRSNGSRTASSTSPPTASTATSRPAATRPRSSGRATTRTSPSTSATASCTPRSRSSPTSC